MVKKPLVALGVAPLLLVGSALTSAAPLHVQHGRTIDAKSIFRAGAHPARTKASGLVYRGGQVETAPAVYIDFWGSWWNTTTTTGTDGAFSYTNAQAMQYVQDFFSNVGGSSWDGLNAQYCQGVATGSVSCGSAGTHIQNLTG